MISHVKALDSKIHGSIFTHPLCNTTGVCNQRWNIPPALERAHAFERAIHGF